MMRVHFLKDSGDYKQGDTPWIERPVARTLCINDICEPYSVFEARAKAAKEEAAADKKAAAVKKRGRPRKKATSKKAESREKTTVSE